MEAVLHFAWQLYRKAQDTSAEHFQDTALAALAGQVPFTSAVWFTGGFERGEFHFHRLHVRGLPIAALKEFIEINRKCPRPMEVTAASPGIPQVFNAPEVYSAPDEAAALEYARQWGIERQLLTAHVDGCRDSGEWLVLYRPADQQPFSDHEQNLVRQLIPHFAESAPSIARFPSEGPLLSLSQLQAATGRSRCSMVRCFTVAGRCGTPSPRSGRTGTRSACHRRC